MSENDTDTCPKCGDERSELVDVEASRDFEHDKVCSHCIVKRSKRYAKEGERGQGQRPIGEQNAIRRKR